MFMAGDWVMDNIQDIDSLVQILRRPLPDAALKHLPATQTTLLQKILPTWGHLLDHALTDQYFCPESNSQVAMIAYSTILALPLNQYSVRLLSRLTRHYPIDSFIASTSIQWEDTVRNIIGIPTRVANYLGGNVPDELEHATYYNNISLRIENFIWSENLSKGP